MQINNAYGYVAQALLLAPSEYHIAQHLKLATSGKGDTRLKSAAVLAVLVVELGLVLALNFLPQTKTASLLAPSTSTNWAAYLHYSFTALQFTLYTLVTAASAGRSVWTFLLPLGYQFAQLASRLQPALKSITGNISLLDRLASFVNSGTAQIAHPASLLDTDQLSSSLKFTLEHWSWFVPLDIAGGILIWLLWTLLSSDEEPAGADKKTDEAKTATSHDVRMKERTAKMFVAFALTSAFAALSEFAGAICDALQNWPESLMFRFTPPACPLILTYFRPRWAIFTIVLGIKLRQIILEHVRSSQNDKKVLQKALPAKKSTAVAAKQ